MAERPSKAQELKNLRLILRRQSIHFFDVARSTTRSPGKPDLVLLTTGGPVAVWLRRYNRAAPLSRYQHAEIEAAAACGWQTLIAFGATEALQEIYRRGICAPVYRNSSCS